MRLGCDILTCQSARNKFDNLFCQTRLGTLTRTSEHGPFNRELTEFMEFGPELKAR